MPHAFIGVDVIVGVRGETTSYFETTYQFIESLPISQLHVFSYSERAGTQALKIEHVVTPTKKDGATYYSRYPSKRQRLFTITLSIASDPFYGKALKRRFYVWIYR